MTAQEPTYPNAPPKANFPQIEKKILAFWDENRIFERSVEQRPRGENGKNEFVFYDGPPFANGLPHYGHILTGYVKDLVPRYQTMRGKRVERRFGWDCHGLPAELETERELEISGKKEIEEFGVEAFNEACRCSVLKYTKEWQRQVHRMGRWVDFSKDYKTMDLSYMESVLWAFKALYDKGLIYEGFRVMPYSWAAQTPVSNFETRIDNAYRERQDPALTVRFTLREQEVPTEIWAWTTTPWTLPSNLALAVGPDLDYAEFEKDGTHILLAEAATTRYAKELEGASRIRTRKGAELIGLSYEPLFPFFKDNEKSFVILGADFVTTEDGTGVVHMAPGFGEDDLEACKQAGIPIVCPVDEAGLFTSEVPTWEGMQVFEANKPIQRTLKEQGRVVRQETYLHNYPHCWRTDTPLIYRAMRSWYVKVTAFRDQMVANNKKIHWIPEHIREGAFGKWLEGARDWSISRNRFWGAPIPIWRSTDPKYPRIDVYGSLDELERDFGVRPKDLHRPFIDKLTRPNPDDPTGKSMMVRDPDVLDCWFESGSMPYAQVHYPFESKEWFENHFPADFIVEYIAQTRGWFYTMVVLATALFNRIPFSNVICHGVVVDENGQKLSKRLRNYPNPDEIFETLGSDALRWFLMSSAILRGSDLSIDREGKEIAEVVRLVLNPVWNAWSFFSLYANADGIRGEEQLEATHFLDRYILAKTRILIEGVTQRMDAYDIPGACRHIAGYLDALNNWYIRRSRDRFWKEKKDQDKKAAYDTLYTALSAFCRVCAPFLPFLCEEIYQGLTQRESVHLEDWPDPNLYPSDEALVEAMDRVRDVCSVALALRRKADLRVRQPLRRLTVAGPGVKAWESEERSALIREEVNIKEVCFEEDFSQYADFVLQAKARILGPRLGPKMKEVLKEAKAGHWKSLDKNRVEVAGEILEGEEFQLLLQPKEGVLCHALQGNRAIVVLDTHLDEELIQEGKIRDLIRAVQQTRKEADLHISDRIRLYLDVPEDYLTAARSFAGFLQEQTLASTLEAPIPGSEEGLFVRELEIEGKPSRIAVRKCQ